MLQSSQRRHDLHRRDTTWLLVTRFPAPASDRSRDMNDNPGALPAGKSLSSGPGGRVRLPGLAEFQPPGPRREAPRRILFIAWRDLANPMAGGSEVLVDQLASGMLARGHQVTLLC